MVVFRCLYAPLSLLLVCACLACGSAPARAQIDGGVPDVVAAQLLVNYPEARDISWDRDRNDSYEAHFKLGGRKLRADFHPDGRWIETEESLKWKDLPKAVRDAVKSEYDKDDIVELEHTVNAEKGEFYDVEIDPKGEKKFDVEYRGDGKRL